MIKSVINIAFIDASSIIFQGLSGSLQLTGKNYKLCFYPNFDGFLQELTTFRPTLVIVNPSIIQYNLKVFIDTRNNQPSIRWVGILYSFYEREVLSFLDGTIQITDSLEIVKNVVETLTSTSSDFSTPKKKELLTARETDILRLMLQSLSNNEIACRLNLSIHTVISHRRSIHFKIGTCKPYELLFYAMSHKIIEHAF